MFVVVVFYTVLVQLTYTYCVSTFPQMYNYLDQKKGADVNVIIYEIWITTNWIWFCSPDENDKIMVTVTFFFKVVLTYQN